MIGRNIQRALHDKGISQREFAKMVGITEVSLSRYINSTRIPKATTLVRMADALGVTAEQLLAEEDYGSKFERLRLRISKHNFSQLVDSIIDDLKSADDRKEFLKYAGMDIGKRIKRENERRTDG